MDTRANSDLVNLGDALASIVFSWIDLSIGAYLEPDPRFIVFNAKLVKVTPDW